MVGTGGVRIRAIGVGGGRQRVADGNGGFVEVPGSIPLGSLFGLRGNLDCRAVVGTVVGRLGVGGGEGRAVIGVGEKFGRAPVLSRALVEDGDGAGQERVRGDGIAILKRIWEMVVGSGDDGGDGGKVAVGVGEGWREVVERVVRMVHVMAEAGRGKVHDGGIAVVGQARETVIGGSDDGSEGEDFAIGVGAEVGGR